MIAMKLLQTWGVGKMLEHIVFYSRVVFTEDVETTKADIGSTRILVNPRFFNSLSGEQKNALILREALRFVTAALAADTDAGSDGIVVDVNLLYDDEFDEEVIGELRLKVS